MDKIILQEALNKLNNLDESFKRNKKLNELMNIKQYKAFEAEIENAVLKIIDKYENMDENFEWKDVDDALRNLVYKCAERWPNDPLPAR